MQGSELEAQVRAELEQIMPIVSALTELPARWSGRVELVTGADFKGKKRFSCDIWIAADLAEQDDRWTTLIHEALHAVSAGYTPLEYESLRGWEEGVVEQMQRLLRPDIFSKLGVTVPAKTLLRLDDEHPYNGYIYALEQVRAILIASKVQFYQKLLSTPLGLRPAVTLMQANSLPAQRRRNALDTVAAMNVILKLPPL